MGEITPNTAGCGFPWRNGKRSPISMAKFLTPKNSTSSLGQASQWRNPPHPYLFSNCEKDWVWPPHNNSDHQVDITFLVGDPYKPSFPTVTGRGPYPREGRKTEVLKWRSAKTLRAPKLTWNHHGTHKRRFGRWCSFSIGWFLDSMWIFRGVAPPGTWNLEYLE